MYNQEENLKSLKISEVSKETSVPASTIREYERLGFIEPTRRTDSGYRIFNKRHIVQVKICRLVFKFYLHKAIRKHSFRIIQAAVMWDIPLCKGHIEKYIDMIQTEIQKAHEAFEIIRTLDKKLEASTMLYSASEAAHEARVTKGTIRNWERNGLFNHVFDKYERRLYNERDIERMKIINMLRQIGYTINIIYNFFTVFDEGDPNALQLLINPDGIEDINEVCDRWLQTLLAAKGHGLEMLDLIRGQ